MDGKNNTEREEKQKYEKKSSAMDVKRRFDLLKASSF